MVIKTVDSRAAFEQQAVTGILRDVEALPDAAVRVQVYIDAAGMQFPAAHLSSRL